MQCGEWLHGKKLLLYLENDIRITSITQKLYILEQKFIFTTWPCYIKCIMYLTPSSPTLFTRKTHDKQNTHTLAPFAPRTNYYKFAFFPQTVYL